MEKYIWSLDVSTTNIGSTLMTLDGKLIELKHLELKLEKDIDIDNRLIHKVEIFKKYAIEYKERVLKEFNGEIIHTIIEKPLENSINTFTAMMLCEFNGMVRYAIYQIFETFPKLISVHESRKIFLNELVTVSYKKNRKTNEVETIETLSFPKNYLTRKKFYIWEKVCKLEPQIEWFYKKDGSPKDINFDMSDSYCCCYSGMRKFNLISNE